jgi:NADP-dependent 3-hydroxy acid dehydrogenase YdfG
VTSTEEAIVPRTIVITGTSSGLGKFCVERFAGEGRNVVPLGGSWWAALGDWPDPLRIKVKVDP